MAKLEPLWTVDARHHGRGSIIYSWAPEAVATTGPSRVVHVVDLQGSIIHQIVPPSPSPVSSLQWDSRGELLAITQAASSTVVLWHMGTQESRELDLGYRELTFLKFSPSSDLLAIGTARGLVIIYNVHTLQKKEALGRHRKRIVCGDWSPNEHLAYASEDRQITICDREGATIDQVKVKCKPQSISFGGKENAPGTIVSVNMEETILLYNLLEKDNALELAFQVHCAVRVCVEK